MAYCIMRVEKRGRPIYGLEIEANRTREDHTQKGRDFAASDIKLTRPATPLQGLLNRYFK